MKERDIQKELKLIEQEKQEEYLNAEPQSRQQAYEQTDQLKGKELIKYMVKHKFDFNDYLAHRKRAGLRVSSKLKRNACIELLAQQNGKCACCDKRIEYGKPLSYDVKHRAIICRKCYLDMLAVQRLVGRLGWDRIYQWLEVPHAGLSIERFRF